MSKAQNVTFGNRNEQAQAELASTKAQLADELRAGQDRIAQFAAQEHVRSGRASAQVLRQAPHRCLSPPKPFSDAQPGASERASSQGWLPACAELDQHRSGLGAVAGRPAS